MWRFVHSTLSNAVAVCACAAGASAQEATFTALGLLPGGGKVGSLAMAVSDDGRVVTGVVGIEDPLDILPFIWTESTGIMEIDGRPPNVLHTVVSAISADGCYISGSFFFGDGRDQAFLWERDVGYKLLPYLSSERLASRVYGIARDGQRLFGYSGAAYTRREAVIWDYPFDAATGLGDLPGGPFYSVLGRATPDGLAASGASYSERGGEAVLWREGAGFTGLGDLPGGRTEGGAGDISADARVVVGKSNGTGGSAGAFRWTEATGMVPLGTLPGDIGSAASATTADGAVVVGDSSSGIHVILTAFVWDRIHGMRDLTALLEDEYGLDLGGWELARATDITPDGRFIVGQARSPTGVFEAFIVQIPPFCYADSDESSGHRVLDFLDFLEFQRCFALRDAYSDCDENGSHDFFDFLCFQNHFAAGCP